MGQESSQDKTASETEVGKRLSEESSNDSYATRLAESFYDGDSDSQGQQFNSPVLSTIGGLDTPTEPISGVSRHQESRVSSLSVGDSATAVLQHGSAVKENYDGLKEGVPVKPSRGRRSSLPRKGVQPTKKPYNPAYQSHEEPKLKDPRHHEFRIPPSGLKPPRPQPSIAPLPPLESNSIASTPPSTPRRSSDDSFATPKQSECSICEKTPPAPTPPHTPDRHDDEEAPAQAIMVAEKQQYKKPLTYRETMLLGFGLTALFGPFSMLVPLMWPKYRQRSLFASYSVGVLSALFAWLAFAIVLALVLVKQ